MLKEEVDEEDIAEVVSKWTGVPVSRLMEGEMQKLVRLEDVLHERVVGQDEAVHAVANAIRRSRAGLVRPAPADRLVPLPRPDRRRQDRAGPRARRLPVRRRAGDGPHRHERVHGEAHGVPPHRRAPGYVGYDEGGQLTEAVRRRPYAVVLLDEIEKAHPDVFNVLLQLLDDGRLTDGQGRTVDFTNVVLIMTSNLPGDPKEFFKPEFINRIDDIVRFRALTEADLDRIVEIQLGSLRERLADRRITLEVTDAATALDRARGLRPDVRRPPAQAGHPARDRRPAGDRPARGHDRRGRPRHRRRRWRRTSSSGTSLTTRATVSTHGICGLRGRAVLDLRGGRRRKGFQCNSYLTRCRARAADRGGRADDARRSVPGTRESRRASSGQ